MPRRSPSRSPSPDPKRRKQSHYSTARSRSPSPTRYSRQGRRGDDRRDSRDHRYDDRGSARDSYRDRDRDRDRGVRRDRHDDRDSRPSRDNNGRRRSRSRSPLPSSNARTNIPASNLDAKTNGSVPPAPTVAPTTPASTEEDEKLKAKRARLEAWKKEQGAKKALSEAKAKAAALASGGRAAPAIGTPPAAAGLPAKPTVQLNRAALKASGLKGLPVKSDALAKASAAAAAMDDFSESGRKLVTLGELPAVDLTVDIGESVGENLEVDDDDDEDNSAINAPDVVMTSAQDDEDDDVDPLDAFMSGVSQEVKKVNAEDRKKLTGKAASRIPIDGAQEEGGDDDDDAEGGGADDLDTTDMRPEDILALAAKKVKKKDIATIDHSKVAYEPFRKDFYRPAPEVEAMDDEDVDLLRLSMDSIKIRGVDCPKPVTKWSHCGLPTATLDVIKKLGYGAPTSIQSQAIPAIMSGRDVIGVAKTGSGKTIAFLLPLFRHIKDQRPLDNMEGAIAIVMTPTRELALQIHRECKPFLKALGLRAVAAYGGSPIKDQIAEMKKGTEIIVCTPGRMIDLLTANSGRVTNLKRVTYLVLDEADRMFDMGFEPQVMKIVNNIRPDRQTVLFSATFPKQMDSLARKILSRPLEITVGGRSVVAKEIDQIIEVRSEESKFNRLLEILGQTYYEDKDSRTLIFVERQESADNLLRDLMRKGYVVMSLHGGKDQVDRDSTINDFKNGVVPIVTATSVAARGLDVKQLKLVINYDAPNHMEDYVHRAGRTGRAGNKGTCITFLTPEQDRYSVDIWRALQASGAEVPPDLERMATSFLEKVKEGKARSYEGSGFGGKGLERLDQERQAKDIAQRTAYGEVVEEKAAATTEDKEGEETAVDPLLDFKIEIKRGPAPDSAKPGNNAAAAAAVEKAKADEARATSTLKAAEEAAAKAGKDTAAFKQAQSVVARLNAQVRATRLALQAQAASAAGDESGRKGGKDPDATDFHAIIPINDYPQKARWRVTNKETMSQLIEVTGASVTNKGIFYEAGKEPAAGAPPKLHLLVESNEEFRVEQAVREIKRLLIEASTAALQAEARAPQPAGRYSVV